MSKKRFKGLVKKENDFFYLIVNCREATFWKDIINEVRHYGVVHPEEKLKRLTKIINQYKSLCDMRERICGIKKEVESIKSYIVSK